MKLLTINDFKQRVLFHLLDYDVRDWATCFAVDQDGSVVVFRALPIANPDFGQWDVKEGDGREPYSHTEMGSVPIPEEINWKDCLWSL